jgi:hypothetical protein
MRIASVVSLFASSLLLAVGLSGCGPAVPAEPTEPERCTAPTTRDVDGGGLDGTTRRAITLGAGDGASFAPWSDGATATVIMGFQGGAMITPTIRVPALPTEGETVCLRVALRNTLSDASEVFPGVVADITFVRVGDVFEAANLFDQLGFDAAALRGKTLMLVVDVTGVTFAGTASLSLVLG